MILGKVAELLFEFFGVTQDEGAIDMAEYISSIAELDDIREWLIDAHGLEEGDERVEQFVLAYMKLKKYPLSEPLHAALLAQEPNRAPEVREIRVAQIPTARCEIREKCFCQARMESGGHVLIGNCLNCGRVVCEAEDYGDCLFCGESKLGRIHWKDLEPGEEANEAVGMKDRLIQYDREGARRTKIFDDSTDWFAESNDAWKSAAEREEAQRLANEFELRKLEAKREMKIAINFQTGGISVIDKQIGIDQVEAERDDALQEWIGRTPQAAVAVIEKSADCPFENVLYANSKALLEKFGKQQTSEFPEKNLNSQNHISLFSFIDEEINDSLDQL